jgi:hypothetical protein
MRTPWPRIRLSRVSSGGGSSGAFRRCLAPPEIATGLSVGLDSQRTSVHVPTYKGVGDEGPLLSNVWDAPDQGVQLEGEGDPDSIWPVRGWDLSNILPLDLNLILNSKINTELSTHFIIDQYIEKLRHNSQLRITRFNNYHAHFYFETDSYLILGP